VSADALLSQLENVKRTGDGRWLARCPAHADRRASLTIRETADEKVLVHCFAGCTVHEVVGAVGLDLADLFPPRPADPAQAGKPERRPFPAADVLRAVSFETMIVSIAAADIAAGKKIKPTDLDRLRIAAGRIQAAARAFE
jgi:hypothetical protein